MKIQVWQVALALMFVGLIFIETNVVIAVTWTLAWFSTGLWLMFKGFERGEKCKLE